MDEYTWPAVPGVPATDAVRQSWLPLRRCLWGPHAGEVIGRQWFGVFIRIDGVPDAVGLAEVGRTRHAMELPVIGTEVAGTIIWLQPTTTR
ncbi:hypothetical protein ACFCYF_03115 [Streptomyces chartreusis]|uniref:hypothetical protein n=1 Tax=Streptomyces chartreusis TaxID=1969 RepID=UPI0035D77DC1